MKREMRGKNKRETGSGFGCLFVGQYFICGGYEYGELFEHQMQKGRALVKSNWKTWLSFKAL